MIVADTDVLVDFLRGRGAAGRVALELRAGALHTTVITAFELRAGARSGRQSSAVDALLSALVVVPLDAAGALRAALVRRGLEDRGAAIGMADSLVAGICLDRGGVLLTRNRKHFGRVPGLRLSASPES